MKSIPDISKFNTSNVINMNGMFYNCKSLLSLPDISKWDTSNVKYLGGIYRGNLLLAPLNDKEILSTPKNEMILSGMFYGCSSSLSLPDISNWNLSNAILVECFVDVHLYHICLIYQNGLQVI